MSNARAVADVTDGRILASVDIKVPPERVFAALSDGAEISRWWGAPGVYTTDRWITDFRVGGSYRAEGTGADGHPFHVSGTFLEIDRPWKIVQTWEPSWDDSLKSTVTYELSAIDDGTRLLVRHDGFKGHKESCEGHAAGWIQVLDWLEKGVLPVAAATPDAAKYYLARLLGPRPDFATTLTPEEREMMLAHGRYWSNHLAQGKVLVLGPVNDPKGSWGLGVMRVDSEEELLGLQAQDPAILSRNGMHYENIPMFRAVWKQ